MKRRTKILFLFTLILSVFSMSCSKDLMRDEVLLEQEIVFSVGFLPKSQTKVTTNDEFKTTFEQGDAVGVFIYKRLAEQESSIESNELYADNVRMVYDGNSWNLDTPVYYTDDETLLDIYAYYPYQPDADPKALRYDASTNMADLLTASTFGIQRFDEKQSVHLLFDHILTLVHLSAEKAKIAPNMNSTFKAYFHGIVGGTLNIATKEMDNLTKGVAEMVLFGPADPDQRTYRAWVPAQQISQNDTLFSFSQTTTNYEFFFFSEATSEAVLSQGHIYQYLTTLKNLNLSDFSYKKYDAFPKFGNPVGMVVEVSNGGKNGKVISIRDAGYTQWSTLFSTTDVTDMDMGISNTMRVQALNNWENDFPAFAACVSFGESWYLPGVNEALPYLQTTVDEINIYLSKIEGHQLIDKQANYWTSTENSDSEAQIINVQGGNPDPLSKIKTCNTRAFYQF